MNGRTLQFVIEPQTKQKIYNLIEDLKNSDIADLTMDEIYRPSPPGSKSSGEILKLVVDLSSAIVPSTLIFLQTWMLKNQEKTLKIKTGDIEVEMHDNADRDEVINLVNLLRTMSSESSDEESTTHSS